MDASLTLDESLIDGTEVSPWDLANQVLYDLCKQYPANKNQQEILAKVLIIGRVYAATIERRRPAADGEIKIKNDAFYLTKVAPIIRELDLDKWINKGRSIDPRSDDALEQIVNVHHESAKIFESIANIRKWSFASKYLHFHAPEVFFIYDSRAKLALAAIWENNRNLLPNVRRHPRDYRWLVACCMELRRFYEEHFAVALSPRRTDNLLLKVSESPLGK